MRRNTLLIGVMAWGYVPESLALAQERLLTIDGERAYDAFGWRLGFPLDFDGDGALDLFITASNGGCADGQNPGAVSCVSTTAHVELFRWCGEFQDTWNNENFGRGIARVSDYDGDGSDDFVVGAPSYHQRYYGNSVGRIQALASETGLPLWELEGDQFQGLFGYSLASIDDVDGDSVRKLIVAAAGHGSLDEGVVFVYSGSTLGLIREHWGEGAFDNFGAEVIEVDDADFDGLSDYAVRPGGLIRSDGVFYLYSGRTGALIRRFDDEHDQILGWSFCSAGDVDGDGSGDLFVGALKPEKGTEYVNAYMYSGADGALIYKVTSPAKEDEFGVSVAVVGDMNGDGSPEVLVGAHLDDEAGKDAGAAYLFSGRTQRLLYKFVGDVPRAFAGAVVSGGVDFNRDRIPDLVVTMPAADPLTAGRVAVFGGNDLFLQASATIVVAGETLELDTRGGPGGALSLLALVAIDAAGHFVPLVWSTLDGVGESTFSGTIPPGLEGHSFTFQAYAQGPGLRKFIDSGRETVTVQ